MTETGTPPTEPTAPEPDDDDEDEHVGVLSQPHLVLNMAQDQSEVTLGEPAFRASVISREELAEQHEAELAAQAARKDAGR